MSSDERNSKEDKVTVTAEMYLTQFKGKALAKAIKNGVTDPKVFAALMENQAVKRKLSNVLAQNVRNPHVIEKLMEAGADVRFDNDALLVYASNEGFKETVDTLLKSGSKPTNRALTVAVANNHVDVVRSLVEVGNLTLTDRVWRAVLEHSDANNEMLRVLCPMARDDQLFDAFKAARENNQIDTAETISESLIFQEGRSEKVRHALVKNLCFTPGAGKDKQLLGILKDALFGGIRPTDKEYSAIIETAEPAVARLVKKYIHKKEKE